MIYIANDDLEVQVKVLYRITERSPANAVTFQRFNNKLVSFFIMVVRTIQLFLTFLFLTGPSLVAQRMKFMFFPSMALGAAGLLWASFIIFADKCARLPVLAHLEAVIGIKIRFAPEVLPVVSILALSFIVVLVLRAPLCFEVEHVKFFVFLHQIDQPRLNVLH